MNAAEKRSPAGIYRLKLSLHGPGALSSLQPAASFVSSPLSRGKDGQGERGEASWACGCLGHTFTRQAEEEKQPDI